MTLIPIAAFLAGSLLTILVPIGLLISLMVWYVVLIRRVPGPADGTEPARSAPESPPSTPPETSPPPSKG